MPFYECSSDCNTQGIQIPASCELSPRDGGINRLVFVPIEAGINRNNADDINTWIDQTTQCNIYVTGRLKGQKPKHSTVTEKLTSCLPEQITGATKTISFLDYNTYEGIEFDFWDAIYQQQTLFRVMAIGCDGRIYPLTDFTLDIDEVIPEDSKSPSYFDGVISFDNDGSIVKPFYWPELLETLIENNCSCSPYIDCVTRPGFVKFEVRIPDDFQFDPTGDKNYDITIACCDPVNGDGCFGTNDYFNYFSGGSDVWTLNSWEFIDNGTCAGVNDFSCVFEVLFNGINNANFTPGLGQWTLLEPRVALFELEISKLQYNMPGCFSSGVSGFCNRKNALKICPVSNFQSDADNCPWKDFIRYDLYLDEFNTFTTLDGATPYTIEFNFQSDCGDLPSLPPGFLWEITIPDATDILDLANKVKAELDTLLSVIPGAYSEFINYGDTQFPDIWVFFFIPISEYSGLDVDCVCNNCLSTSGAGHGSETALMQSHTIDVNGSPMQFYNMTSFSVSSCCACDTDTNEFEGVPGTICYPGSDGQEGDPPTPACDLVFELFVHESMLSGGDVVITWTNLVFGQPDRNPNGTDVVWVIPATPTGDMFAFLAALQAEIDAQLTGANIPYTIQIQNTSLVNNSVRVTFSFNTLDAYPDQSTPLCNCSGENVGFGDNDKILVNFSAQFGSTIQDNRAYISVECCPCSVEPQEVCEYPDTLTITGCWFDNDFDNTGDDTESLAIVWPSTLPNNVFNGGCIPYGHLGITADDWKYDFQPGDDLTTAVSNFIINVTAAYNVIGVPITITVTTSSGGQECVRIEIPVEVMNVGVMYSPNAVEDGCGCNCHLNENENRYGETKVDMLNQILFTTANFQPFDINNYNVGANQKVEMNVAETVECCDCTGGEVEYQPDPLCEHLGYYKYTFDWPAGIAAGDLVEIQFNNSCVPKEIPFGNSVTHTVIGGQSNDDIFNSLMTELQNDVDAGVLPINIPSDGGTEEFWIPVENAFDGLLNFGDGEEDDCNCYCADGIPNGYGFMQANMTATFKVTPSGGGLPNIVPITVECCDCQEV